MKQPKIASKGKRLISPRAYFLSNFFSSTMHTEVSVPVVMSSSLFVFDFEQEISRFEELKDLSQSHIRQILAVMSRAVGVVDQGWLRATLQEAGFSDDMTPAGLENITRMIRDSMIQSIGRSGISSLLIRDVLNTTEFKALDKPESIEYSNLQTSIGIIQELYSKFASSDSVEAVGAFISETINANSFMAYVRMLYSIFHKTNAPSVPIKLSYVTETIMTSLFDERPITYEAVIPGYEYRISDVGFMQDVTFADATAASVLGLRTIMGIDLSNEQAPLVRDLPSIATQMITGIGSIIPSLPEGLTIDVDRSQKLLLTIFFHRLIHRLTTSEFGTLEGRVRNVMDSRKYERNEAFDSIIRESLQVCSVVFESFLDACAYFKNMALDESVHFTDIRPRFRKKYSDLVFDFYGQFKTFFLPTTHVRFMREPALVTNHQFESSASMPETFLPDSEMKGGLRAVMSLSDMSTYEFYKSDILTGSAVDAKLDFPLKVLSLAKNVMPQNFFSVPVPESFKHDLFKYEFSFIPINDLAKNTDFLSHYTSHAHIVMVSNVEEFMREFALPYAVAKSIFKKPELFVDISGISKTIYHWEDPVAPCYESFQPESTGDYAPHIDPLITRYPFLMVNTFTSISAESQIIIDDPIKKPKPNQGSPKPNSVPVKDPVNPDDPESDPTDPEGDPGLNT